MDLQNSNWQQFIWQDYLLIGFIIVTFVLGAYRGLIKEIIGLIFLIAAIWGAVVFHTQVSELDVMQVIDTPKARLIVSFIVIFLTVLISGKLISITLEKILTITGLGSINRILGGMFSVIKYSFIVFIIFAILNKLQITNNSLDGLVNKTYFSSIIQKGVKLIEPRIPKELKKITKE